MKASTKDQLSILTLKQLFMRLAPLPEAEWKEFSHCLRMRTIAKKGQWIKIGGSGNEIGFILSGLMKVFYVTEKGGEFVRTFRSEGQFVASYSSALTAAPSKVAIEALEKTHLVTFRYDDFKRGFERHESWQEIARKMTELQYLSYEKRTYELACLSAEERYHCFREEFSHLNNRLSQTQIAAYLSITPISLSRLLSKRWIKK